MPRLRKGVGGREPEPSIVVPLTSTSSAARTEATSTAKGSKEEPVKVPVKKGGVSENVKSRKATTAVKRSSPSAEVAPAGGGGGDGGVKKPRTKFPERLQWKMKHLGMPATSTPKRDPKAKKLTKQDIDTAFGFDDSYEPVADYSTLLSPIAHASPKGIIPPVWKIHPLSQRNVDPVPGPSSSKQKQLPRQQQQRLQDGGQERRSPRLQKDTQVIKIPISSASSAPPATTSAKKPPVTVTAQLPPPAPKSVEKSTASLGDIELPSVIEVSVTPSLPKSKTVTTTSSSSKPAEVVKEVPVVPVVEKPEEKPKRGRVGRAKKQQEAAPVKAKAEESDKPMTTKRVTRSRKGTAPAAVTKPDPVEPKPSTSKRTVKQVPPTTTSTASFSKSPSVAAILKEFEADDEQDEEPVVVTKAKPTLKKVAKSKKKPAPATTISTAPVVQSKAKKFPVYLQNKPHVLEEEYTLGGGANQKDGTSPFSQLLNRYNEDETPAPGKEPEFYLDPKKITRTYGSRKRAQYSEERDPETDYDFIPKATTKEAEEDDVVAPSGSKSKGTRKGQKSKKRGGVKKDDEDMDEEERRWLEEKNKEFDEVLKTKLVIEQSFSD